MVTDMMSNMLQQNWKREIDVDVIERILAEGGAAKERQAREPLPVRDRRHRLLYKLGWSGTMTTDGSDPSGILVAPDYNSWYTRCQEKRAARGALVARGHAGTVYLFLREVPITYKGDTHILSCTSKRG